MGKSETFKQRIIPEFGTESCKMIWDNEKREMGS